MADQDMIGFLTEGLYWNNVTFSLYTRNFKDGSYRMWKMSEHKLAAAIYGGIEKSFKIGPGSVVLYLGADSQSSISHVSDIVGLMGRVYAVDLSPNTREALQDLADRSGNIFPIFEDPRDPSKYSHRVPDFVDVLYSEVHNNDGDHDQTQAEILIRNAECFYKNRFGHFLMSIQYPEIPEIHKWCEDTDLKAEEYFAEVVDRLRLKRFRPKLMIELAHFVKGYACVAGEYLGTQPAESSSSGGAEAAENN